MITDIDKIMGSIESLLETFTYALSSYENSQTCSRQTYLKQMQDMSDAKAALLERIRDEIAKSKAL